MLNNVSPQRIVISNAAIIELVKDINFSYYIFDLGCGSGIYKKYFKKSWTKF